MDNKLFMSFVYDIVSLLVFAIPIVVFNSDTIPTTINGFYCRDTGIRYPYHDGQVPSWALFIEGFFYVFTGSLVIEFLFIKFQKTKYIKESSKEKLLKTVLFFEVYRAVGYFLIGVCANQFFTDIGKHTVGRLRPHFWDLCRPNVTCTTDNMNDYISDYKCLNTEHPLIKPEKFEDRLLDARKSFPSGHSSFALYCAIFFVLYSEYRLGKILKLRLARHFFQLIAMAWSLWVCGTRIVDFKHRFSDVAAGMIIGTVTATFIFFVYRTSKNLYEKVDKAGSSNSIPMVQQS